MSYLNEINAVWETVRKNIAESKKMTSVATDLWFGDLSVNAMDEKKITMSTPSEFKFDIINKKYLDAIRDAFSEALGFEIDVVLECENAAEAKKAEEQTPSRPESPSGAAQEAPSYNFEYTFDNFIVGNSNKFAHAACTAVAEHPAQNYNPLFIYGPSGIGKTHLLYAVTNKIKKDKPDVKIIYVKGEDFTNQFISALAAAGTAEFRNKYRSCDVLLIDDIQFIADKERTQEEFFHTFNALYENQKQIVLTSDRPPSEIGNLQKRLVSRFEWGLPVEMEMADLETRVAILRSKRENLNLAVGDEAIQFIAEHIRTNIRKLEGALIRVAGYMSLTRNPKLTQELLEYLLRDAIEQESRAALTLENIQRAVAEHYDIRVGDMTGRQRPQSIAFPRQVAMYLCREMTDQSLPEIGRAFNRNHATVLHAVRTIGDRMKTDATLRQGILALQQRLNHNA